MAEGCARRREPAGLSLRTETQRGEAKRPMLSGFYQNAKLEYQKEQVEGPGICRQTGVLLHTQSETGHSLRQVLKPGIRSLLK